MIVKINTKYWTSKETVLDVIPFFEQHGRMKEAMDPNHFHAEYVGHIDLVPVEVLQSKGVEIEFYKNAHPDSMSSTLLAMMDKFSSKDFSELKAPASGVINIHLPSPELSFFNQIDFEEDSCTNEIQRRLDDGWRIVACIPRPGQRRPDYILGRKV